MLGAIGVEIQSPLAGPQSDKPPDFAAFVSHAQADHAKAEEIVAALEGRGFKCWIAPRDVRPGRTYGDEIVRGIAKSRCFILVLSAASNESAFVAREVERAVSKNKPVFTIRIEDVQPSPALELFISNTQWIDGFSGGWRAQVDRLASLIAVDDEGEPEQASVSQAPVAARWSGRWGKIAGFAATVLLVGVGAALLPNFQGRGPESAPPPSAPAPVAPPAESPTPSPPAPSSESPEPSEPSPDASPAQRVAEPTPAAPRPRSSNESCSRSGDMTICTSSVLATSHGISYGPGNLTDGDDATAWVEGSSGQGAGEFVVLEFDAARAVRGLSIKNGYDKSPDIYAKNSRVKDIELRFSTGDSLQATLKDAPGAQQLALSSPVDAKWVELIIRSVYPGSKYSDTAINELGVDAE